ncbi:MAG: hypothetical protein AAFP89_08890 [Bacteroidota bacterium]
MKKIWLYFLPVLAISLSFTGCLQDTCVTKGIVYEFSPVYMSKAEVRASVGVEAARELVNPGKLYYYYNFLLINEINEGFHVIDNSNPENPVNLSFIKVPGSHDMAVKGDVLYADSYMDLVAISIIDPNNPVELSRDEDVFEYGSWHPSLWADEAQGVAVRFDRREIEQEVDCANNGGQGGWMRRNVFIDFTAATLDNSAEPALESGGGEVPTGIGGSMARFTLVNNYMYVVTETDLLSFDVSNTADPMKVSDERISWGGVETIYPFRGSLFIGTMTGMFIYSLDNPATPTYTSQFTHARACDPVVVADVQGITYAFVTLREGTRCGGAPNQLHVVNVQNLTNPVLVASYDMNNPQGLGVQEEVLYLCDGDAGLKVFDVSDVNKIDDNRMARFKNIDAYDVIPLGKYALMIGKDGFFQYDIEDPNNITLVSSIPVNREN